MRVALQRCYTTFTPTSRALATILGICLQRGVSVKQRRLVASRTQQRYDVGTLWTLRRATLAARCALLAWSGGWEVRLLIDGDILKTERCERGDGAFALAARWKRRMLEHGWEPAASQSQPSLSA